MSKERISWRHALVWVIAGVILSIGIVMRYFAFSMPVVGDEAVYGILGKKAIEGAALYRDIYEMKPPLLFYVYGLAMKIFGWGTTGLRIAGTFLVIFNSFMIFSLSRKYVDMAFSAVIGATSFFLLNNVYAYTTETAAEHFYLAFALSGYYLLVNPLLKNISWNTFLAGFLICGSAMIKQTAALFGVGALVLLVVSCLHYTAPYSRKSMLRNVLFLGIGALSMVVLNILPVLLTGTWKEATYWLIDVPSSYGSSINFGDSLEYLDYLGMRILSYQNATIVLCVLGFVALFLKFRERYFPLFMVLAVMALLVIIPGFRYYSQYWIALMTVLALFLLPLRDLLLKLRLKPVLCSLIVSAATLTCIIIDTVQHSDEYFERDYVLNAEKAYSGSFAYVHMQMTNYIKERLGNGQPFLMLGSQPFTYYSVDRFPLMDHVYPRIISRNTVENRQYQARAITQMKNGNYPYVLFSVTGIAWRTKFDNIDDWYQDAFAFMQSEYEPVVSYNFDSRQYSYAEQSTIDTYVPNQLIIFKKR